MFKKITIPLYYSTLIIGLDKNQIDAVTKLNNQNPGLSLNPTPHACAVTYNAIWSPIKGQEKHMVFVCFGEDSMDMGTIAHETVHAVNCVFNNIGLKLDGENDEAQAYLTGWIAEQIGLAVTEYNNKKIKKDGKKRKITRRK